MTQEVELVTQCLLQLTFCHWDPGSMVAAAAKALFFKNLHGQYNFQWPFRRFVGQKPHLPSPTLEKHLMSARKGPSSSQAPHWGFLGMLQTLTHIELQGKLGLLHNSVTCGTSSWPDPLDVPWWIPCWAALHHHSSHICYRARSLTLETAFA